MNQFLQFIREMLNRSGFDVIRVINKDIGLSKHLKIVLSTMKIDCVIDVGANAGQYGKFLRELGYQGFIASFEPVKEVFQKLQAASDNDPKWICYNLALGDRSEQKVINVHGASVFTSFLHVNEYSQQRWSLDKGNAEDVSVVRLDDVFEDLAAKTGGTNFFLKMDTQGYDRKVFAGSLGSLARIKGLQSELSLLPIYNDMPRGYDVLEDYHAQNYFVSGMYPVNRDDSLAVIEYDCILVRKDLAVRP
jgi:FkbM family methyltransferase